jgi:hypothetical protein
MPSVSLKAGDAFFNLRHNTRLIFSECASLDPLSQLGSLKFTSIQSHNVSTSVVKKSTRLLAEITRVLFWGITLPLRSKNVLERANPTVPLREMSRLAREPRRTKGTAQAKERGRRAAQARWNISLI